MNNLQILMMGGKQRAIYGYLYNYYAINDANFAPSGMRVPTLDDFSDLITEIGGDANGGDLKETGTTFWTTPNTDATNSSGFTAYGGGHRNSSGAFGGIKASGEFWAAGSNDGLLWLIYNTGLAYLYNYSEEYGMSVRLVSDTNPGSTILDYDNNVYDIVQIGTQYWTIQNWKCTRLNNGTSLTLVENATTWGNAVSGDQYYCAYNNDYSNV